MTLDLYALLTNSLVYFTFVFTLSVCLLAFYKVTGKKESESAFLLLYAAAAALTWGLCKSPIGLLLASGLAMARPLAARRLKDFSVSGQVLVVVNVLLALTGTIWGLWFIAGLQVSTLTRGLMLVGSPLVLLTLPFGLLQALEQWEVLIRKRWHRPGPALSAVPRAHYPRICLQLPCYAEPPELVIETLDALARLHYPNFQVMVIDNNTRDPDLWKPLEAHCAHLGERFRFLHVENLAGAKAGALNYAMRQLDSDVEIIGVIDSDYLAEPTFLASLVSYFDDARIGFVQTPHDYRGWERSPYLKMCYWEYRGFFMTTMVSLNERDAGLTVGTMCLIRRCALEEAGGWSEWCQTEDSELAIRIHAAGYSSVYVPETFGRGLIPETFAGYKKQRFRWTCGPVQEFKHHLPLFLPRPFALPSALTTAQKLHHLNHGLGPFSSGVGFVLTPLGLAVVASMLLQHESIAVPTPLWAVTLCSFVSGWLLTWLVYCVHMQTTSGEMLGALIARQALAHTALMASVRGVFTERIAWKRTNKFKSLPSGLVALSSASGELAIGLGLLGSAAALIYALQPTGLALWLVAGIVLQGLSYFCAPALALLAERDLRAQQPAPRPKLAFRPVRAVGLAAALAAVFVFSLRLADEPPLTGKRTAPSLAAPKPVMIAAVPLLLSPRLLSPDTAVDAVQPQIARPPSPTPRPLPTVSRQETSALDLGSVEVALAAELPGPEAALLTDQPHTTEFVRSPTGLPDCYETDAKTYDYRCRNRKN